MMGQAACAGLEFGVAQSPRALAHSRLLWRACSLGGDQFVEALHRRQRALVGAMGLQLRLQLRWRQCGQR